MAHIISLAFDPPFMNRMRLESKRAMTVVANYCTRHCLMDRSHSPYLHIRNRIDGIDNDQPTQGDVKTHLRKERTKNKCL